MYFLATILLSSLLNAPFASQNDTVKTKPIPESLKKLFEQVVKQVKTTNSNDYEIEIDGLLVDDTKKKKGKYF